MTPGQPQREAKSGSILVAGLPESGKSTFIVALWHLLTNAPSGATQYREVGFVGNREHIQKLEQRWVAATPLQRTERGSDQHLELTLESLDARRRTTLLLPDLSGEDFEAYFARREWPEALHDFVTSVEGVLLFVSPNALVSPFLLADVEGAALAAGAAAEHEGGGPAEEADEEDWDPEKAPTAVILVDLLNCIIKARADDVSRLSHPLPIGIIVSAWDALAELGMSPEEWLARDAALLDQFLRSNTDLFEARSFGVSAQGGDVNDEAVRAQLLSLADPYKRIRIVEEGLEGHDLSRPISWILERRLSGPS